MWQSRRFRQSGLALRQAFQFIATRIYPVASPAPFKTQQFIELHSSLDFEGMGVNLFSISPARMRKSVSR